MASTDDGENEKKSGVGDDERRGVAAVVPGILGSDALRLLW
jgi:hypothetical protein